MGDAAMVIEPFDWREAGEDEFRHRYEHVIEIERELRPEDPVTTWDEFRKGYEHEVSWNRSERFSAWSPDRRELLGIGNISYSFTETNQHLAWTSVSVVAHRRREGIGSALLRPLVEIAQREERRVLNGGALEDSPGEAFMAALGFERRFVNRSSRLMLSGVDRKMLEGWVERAAERANEYELVGYDDRCPDELLDGVIAIQHVLNTAPRDDLDMEDWVVTPERFRESEAKSLEMGYGGWMLLARHRPTGEIAGYTELGFSPYEPERAFQGGTAVDPAHRNKGLGRWLKAALLLRLLDERPGVEMIDTDNAESNDPMLAINVAMGFAPIRASTSWQADTDSVAKRLADRG